MKRIATWFLSPVTVVVLMFGYHTSTVTVERNQVAMRFISGHQLNFSRWSWSAGSPATRRALTRESVQAGGPQT